MKEIPPVREVSN